ncbi:hypothetical protein HOY80DRAFT_887255 [Tuber brumale]|nr:hypothetical protein HOY80DRAFT_887255 [Tuber brumale]
MEIPILPYMVYQYTFKRLSSRAGWFKSLKTTKGEFFFWWLASRVDTAPALPCDDDDYGDDGFDCRK